MKALVYTGPKQLEIREVPDPALNAGDVLVHVESCGICGSDMHGFLGHDERRPAPLILGHEVAGTADLGHSGKTRVTVNPLVSCGKCAACKAGRDNICSNRQIISMPPREGGFAQLLSIPRQNIVEVPDHITSDQAALVEPIACGWHASQIAIAHKGFPGNIRALVLGGGAIGLGASLSLKALGVGDIVVAETNELRREFLQKSCDQVSIHPDELEPADEFDIVIDAVGIAPTRSTASRLARPGGIILHIGLGSAEGGLDVRRMTLQEIAFVGTYTYTSHDFKETAQALFDGRLGALDWIEARPLSDGSTAFQDILAGRVASPKIILKPTV